MRPKSSHLGKFGRAILAVGMVTMLSRAWSQGIGDTVSVPSQSVITQPVRVEQEMGHQVPLSAEFLDQDGRRVRVGGLLNGRPVIVLPIFYRCLGVCSTEFESLVSTLPKLDKRVGRDYDVVVLSIDPQEGPELAKEKMQSALSASPALKGTESGWHFLTGDLGQIRSLTDSLGFKFTYDAATDRINHPAGLMFLSPNGRISSYILYKTYSAEDLSKGLDLATRNAVGLKSPDVFFGCIHIDPLTGHRSIVIERFLSLAGALTLFCLVATIAGLSIKSKKARSLDG